MKAIVKNTGGVSLKVEGVYLENGYDYSLDEIEIIHEKMDNSYIDWEQRKFELVKAAMQGTIPLIENGSFSSKNLAAKIIELADTVLDEYRKEGNE